MVAVAVKVAVVVLVVVVVVVGGRAGCRDRLVRRSFSSKGSRSVLRLWNPKWRQAKMRGYKRAAFMGNGEDGMPQEPKISAMTNQLVKHAS